MARATTSDAHQTKAPRAQRRRRGRAFIPAGVTLALWRLKPMWRLLVALQVGLLAAVMLLSAVPLFSRVATAAGLEGAVRADPLYTGGANINASLLLVDGATDQPTAARIHLVEQRAQAAIAHHFSYLSVANAPASFQMVSLATPLATPPATSLAPSEGRQSPNQMALFAQPLTELAVRLHLVEGRLPEPAVSGLEIAVTQATGARLGLQPGSTLTLGEPSETQLSGLTVQVVGIVAPGQQDDPISPDLDPQPVTESSGATGGMHYWGVTSSEAVQASVFPWGRLDRSNASAGKGGATFAFWLLHWEYPTQLRLDLINTDDLAGYQGERYQALLEMQGIPGMQPDRTDIFTTVPDILYNYAQHIVFVQAAVVLLLVTVLGLVLLFLGQMAHALVERQEELIVMLRSRGASRRQIFAAFAVQGLGPGVIALVAGLLLAVPLVRLVAERLVPPHSEGALALLAGNPLEVAGRVWVYAAIATGATVVALLFALGRAARHNALALRQETTRAARRPLWQRLYLDVLAALLAFAGFGTYALALRLVDAAPSSANTTARTGLDQLALVAPLFLMVAGALLFLRLFPLLLRLCERLALQRRGASGALAFTQLARDSRPARRITLLLALCVCFVVFALGAKATASQRVLDVAAHRVGADFSGGLDRSTSAAGGVSTDLASLADAYRAIPGVLSASVAYRTVASTARVAPGPVRAFDGEGGFVQIAAVDADTFAGTAIWGAQDSAEPLADLLATLRAHRAGAAADGVVSAIVDAEVADLLQLHPGGHFALAIPGYDTGEMHFIVAAQVAHIPTTYNAAIYGSGPNGTGGMLVDYASFAAVYAHDTGDATGQAVAPNYVWLRSRDDAASLASVRAAIANGPLHLTDLGQERGLDLSVADRRALIQQLRADPMRVEILGVLAIAAAAVLGLGLLGALLATWLWLRRQQPAFALLRALGLEPRRLGRVLYWEQGIVYAVALLVGVLLGAVLMAFAVPPLVELMFTGMGMSSGGLAYDGGPPVRLVLALEPLALVVTGLAVVCAAAMMLSARLAARPALARTLRLDDE